jgi:predicted enzyme related to lactoylglutathione lyase
MIFSLYYRHIKSLIPDFAYKKAFYLKSYFMANENPNNAIVWFEIYVDNLARATKFYESVLDIRLENMADPTDGGLKMASFPMKEGKPNASGSLVQMEGMKAGGNSVIVYFDCADCSVEESRVEKSGGKIHRAKMSIGPHGFMSLCQDTEGNIFGLHSMK